MGRDPEVWEVGGEEGEEWERVRNGRGRGEIWEGSGGEWEGRMINSVS